MAALASGRQRQLVAEAQAVAGELKELPMASAASPSQNDLAFHKLADLARLIKKLRESTAQLTDESSKPMWEQRSVWMHQELIELAAERLQGGDPSQYWNNVAQLMYAGAAGHEAILQERNALQKQVENLQEALEAKQRDADRVQHELAASQVQVKELEERVESNSAAAAAQQESAASSEEVMELRTKLMMAQQELQRRNDSEREEAATSRGHHHMVQGPPGSADDLGKRVKELSEENEEYRVEEARQSAVITTLMQESEITKKRMEAANQKTAEVQQHNRTLSVNLETQAAVVEKLIELNTELMDNMNNRAFGHTTAAVVSKAGGGASAPASPEVVVSVEGDAAAEPSFTAALQEFLTDDFKPPRKADASVLSSAPHVNGNSHRPSTGAADIGTRDAPGAAGDGGLMTGVGGLWGGLSKAAAFVSGSDRVVEVLPVSTTISHRESIGGVDSPMAVV